MPRISVRPLIALALALLLSTSGSRATQFLNLSTRGYVGPDDHALIGGFILRGSVGKRVLVRGLGPSLTGAGLSDVLSNPTIELRNQNGFVVLANNDWQETQKNEIEETALAPHNDQEAAIVANLLAPGSYTVVLRGIGNGSGIGLIEIYDLSPNAGSLLANISTRGFIETGDRVMIGGFIIGAGNETAQIIARGIGPSLAEAGIDDSLADPTLELRSSTGALLAANDNWKTSQQALVEQTGIPPHHDLESAIVSDLTTGSYTAILRGNAGVGTGLVEFYHLNAPSPPLATFSFETGLENWLPKATDTDHPTVAWSIESSQDRALDGTRSAKFALENLNDAGKIWLERAFSVRPNQSYHVKVQFSFGTADFGDVNHWTIIAGVRNSPAVTRSDLTYQGSTGNGESSNTGYKWLEKSYDFDVLAAADGMLYVDLGVWGTWETYRAYYIDNLRLSVTAN